MTGFACALALERLPEFAAAWGAAGHDICCHGWRWVHHRQLSEAEEREHIARASGKMMSLGMDARVLGHPPRAAGLARFLDYAASLPDVWICTRIDIARHWPATYPPPAA
jgi:peptidoglycan/xylan/chitin deacetylase (PgdA/CDA1 family)